MTYPVHFEAIAPGRFTRLQLGLRILAGLALGVVGVSVGGLFCLLYLLLPLAAAVRIATRGSSRDYALEDGPRVLFLLRWLASVTSWLGLAVERLPHQAPDETIRLSIDGTPSQSAGAAALRTLSGLPSALLLALLSLFGCLVWLWAALTILLGESMAESAWAYLVGLQRYGYRLLAYQAALVDDYPPFALSETSDLPGANPAS
jgi:hypothetical protein